MTKKKEVVAYSYEQASEYARDILKSISGSMPWTQFHKVIGVSYSSMMSFKYNIRPNVEMPHVVERILQFGYSHLEHRREYIYTFDPNEFPETFQKHTQDPIQYINEYRLPDLTDQLQRLKSVKGEKPAQVMKEIRKVEKEIKDVNELVKKLKSKKKSDNDG